MPTVYRISYRIPGAMMLLKTLLAEHPDLLVIDTRQVAQSHFAEWRGEALQTQLGERYRWDGETLGNENYQGGPIALPNLSTGLRQLRDDLLHGHTLALLCGCPCYDTCHLKTIITALHEWMPAVEIEHPQESVLAEGTTMCLSVQQPYAWLLSNPEVLRAVNVPLKMIENRDWKTAYRGPLLIHASKKVDAGSFLPDGGLSPRFRQRFGDRIEAVMPLRKGDYATGVIVGMAELSDVITESDDPWFMGTYGFVLTHAHPLVQPLPYRGQMKLFGVPTTLLTAEISTWT